MSDQGDRATVAIVVAKLDGLRELTRAEFSEVKTRLDRVEGLPERVVRLEEQVRKLESESTRRSNVVPGILIGVFGLVIAIVNILVVFGHAG
jgi:hypothetical protein